MRVSLASLARIICPIVAALPLLLKFLNVRRCITASLICSCTGYRVGRGIGFLTAGSYFVSRTFPSFMTI